jgi:hypothetical protein
MKKQFVYDPLISKRQQFLLATQVSAFHMSDVHLLRYRTQLVRAVLKIGEPYLLSLAIEPMLNTRQTM